MAFSYVEIEKAPIGDATLIVYECTFGSVTAGAIKTGFSNVIMADHNNETTEADGKTRKNIASDGSTVEYGSVYFSGFTSNDVATVRVVAK